METAQKTEEIEVQLTEKDVAEISEKVGETLTPKITEEIAKSIDEKIEAGNKALIDEYVAKTEEIDKSKKKEIKEAALANDLIAKGLDDGSIDEDVAKMSPQMRFYRQMIALVQENHTELKRFNSYAVASQAQKRAELAKDTSAKGLELAQKAGYGNETTASDGSVLVPDADFVTTLYDNLPNYGVAFSDANVRQTDRTAVRVISLDSGLTFFSTAEAGVKTSAKLAFSKNEVSLQKYAVIVPATDELTEDAAIDYWAIVTQELTRAYALLADQITFTNSVTGITNLSGVLTENVSGAGTTISWNDLLDSQAKLEDDLDESDYKWYMRKETWYRLVETKGVTNDHYLAGSLNTATGWVANINQPTTPWGTPVKFTRVLPTSNAVSANDAFAVYGNLKNYLLYNKSGMALKMLTEATIIDQASQSTNLATQDLSAMRAVVRLLGICPNGNRAKFVVLGTGTVS